MRLIFAECLKRNEKKIENSKISLEKVEKKLEELIGKNISFSRDIVKIKNEIKSTKEKLVFQCEIFNGKTRLLDGPFEKGTKLIKYFSSSGIYEGQVKKIPTHNNEFYSILYVDGDSEELSFEEVQQYATFYEIVKNSDNEGLIVERADGIIATSSVNEQTESLTTEENTTTVPDSDTDAATKGDDVCDNDEEKGKKRELLFLLEKTFQQLKESSKKARVDDDCKILTMELKDNISFFQNIVTNFEQEENDGKPRAK